VRNKKSTMSEHTQNRWPNRRRHEAHGGDLSGIFCGRTFNGIRTMVQNFCMENPARAQ